MSVGECEIAGLNLGQSLRYHNYPTYKSATSLTVRTKQRLLSQIERTIFSSLMLKVSRHSTGAIHGCYLWSLKVVRLFVSVNTSHPMSQYFRKVKCILPKQLLCMRGTSHKTM